MPFVDPLFYPADCLPGVRPDIAIGTLRLTNEWNIGAAFMNIHPDNPAAVSPIGFTGANEIANASVIDAALSAAGKTRGRAPFVANQMSPLGTNFSMGGTNDAAAVIGQAQFGGIRALYFEGGSDFAGIMDWGVINTDFLNLRAHTHTIVMVIKPTTTLARNTRNNLAPTVNCIYDLSNDTGSKGTLLSDGTNAPEYHAICQGLHLHTPSMPPEVSPSVVTVVRNENYVRIRQNGQMRKIVGALAPAEVVKTMWIARRLSSANPPVIPPFVPMNEAGDFWMWALMVYNNLALDEGQCATIDRSFALRFGSATGIGKVNRDDKAIMVVGDSISAENSTDALDGWLSQLQRLAPYPVLVRNCGVSGSTETTQGFDYASTSGIWNTHVLPFARSSPKKNQLIYFGGGNDAYIGVPPSAASVAASIGQHCQDWVLAGGTKPIVLTILKRNDGAFQVHHTAVNVALRAAAGPFYDICDTETIPQFDGTNNSFIPDGTHPSGTGGALIANFILSTVFNSNHLGATP